MKEEMCYLYFCEELNVIVIAHPEYVDPETGGTPVEWGASDMYEVQSKYNFKEVFVKNTWTYVGNL